MGGRRVGTLVHPRQDGALSIVMLTPVSAGAELTLSYTKPDAAYDERRATLREHYHFDCICPRCTAEQRAPEPPR